MAILSKFLHFLWKLFFPGQTPVPPRSGTWILDLSHDPIWAIWLAEVNKFHQHHDRIDFSTLYTNLPLDVIYGSLKSLINKLFANSKSIAIFVNSYRKNAFWSNGSSYPGYREYTIDKPLEALESIIFNTYIQFNDTVFKQLLDIPMGENASPFNADLYLSWCKYCNVTKSTKTDYNLAKRLSYNCRYLDDICTKNLKDFRTISKDIYDNTLILEGSTCSYKRDNFLDLYIRVIDDKFVTGIYHKVDDFNFEVISYPFPDSNIHSSLRYSTFYSQQIRFHRFVITSQISCSELNLRFKT